MFLKTFWAITLNPLCVQWFDPGGTVKNFDRNVLLFRFQQQPALDLLAEKTQCFRILAERDTPVEQFFQSLAP